MEEGDDCPIDPAARAIASDTEQGATALSFDALAALEERAREADDWTAVAARARALRDARPAMPVVANRVNRAMASADDRTPGAVLDATRRVTAEARDADEAAARGAATRSGASVLTLSRSGTVRKVLETAQPDHVFVAESRPAREGVEVAEWLAESLGSNVTLLVDTAVAALLATGRVDTVLVGADTIGPDGSVLNKVGTRTTALAAAHEEVPCLVVTTSDKVSTSEPVVEYGDRREVYSGDADVDVYAPTFDLTPADLVTVVTEDGALSPADVATVAANHRTDAQWDDTHSD